MSPRAWGAETGGDDGGALTGGGAGTDAAPRKRRVRKITKKAAWKA
jgi:hypothetical protein